MFKKLEIFCKKLFKNLNKLYLNFTMRQCPNCKEKGFEKNILEKKFIRKTTTFISDNSFNKYSSNEMSNRYNNNEREIEVNVYNIKYLCKHCNSVIEQEINDERNYGDLKILMTYSEYEKFVEK